MYYFYEASTLKCYQNENVKEVIGSSTNWTVEQMLNKSQKSYTLVACERFNDLCHGDCKICASVDREDTSMKFCAGCAMDVGFLLYIP